MSKIYGTCRRHGSGSEKNPFTSHLQSPLHHIHSHPSLFTLLTPFTPTRLFQAGTLAAPAQKAISQDQRQLEALKDPWKTVFTLEQLIKSHMLYKMFFIIFIKTLVRHQTSFWCHKGLVLVGNRPCFCHLTSTQFNTLLARVCKWAATSVESIDVFLFLNDHHTVFLQSKFTKY